MLCLSMIISLLSHAEVTLEQKNKNCIKSLLTCTCKKHHTLKVITDTKQGVVLRRLTPRVIHSTGTVRLKTQYSWCSNIGLNWKESINLDNKGVEEIHIYMYTICWGMKWNNVRVMKIFLSAHSLRFIIIFRLQFITTNSNLVL